MKYHNLMQKKKAGPEMNPQMMVDEQKWLRMLTDQIQCPGNPHSVDFQAFGCTEYDILIGSGASTRTRRVKRTS